MGEVTGIFQGSWKGDSLEVLAQRYLLLPLAPGKIALPSAEMRNSPQNQTALPKSF